MTSVGIEELLAAPYAWFAAPAPTLGLALARVALGSVLAFDGLRMLRDHALWYADDALRPRGTRRLPAWLDAFAWAGRLGLPARVVPLAQVVAALAFAAGLGTTAAGLALLLVCIAIPARNLFIVYGGDAFARTILLLLLCSPCAAALSADRWLHDGTLGLDAQAPLWGGRLIAVEVALLYLHNFLCKWPLPAWRDGTYMFALLRNKNFARTDVPAPLRTAAAGRAMTHGALLVELLLGPALLFPATAGPACAVAIGFHLAIARTVDVHLFSYIMIAALLACLPRGAIAGLVGGDMPVLPPAAAGWADIVALCAAAIYMIVAIAWDPPRPGWCSRQVQRALGPAFAAIHWVRSWRLFVDSSATHIELEFTAVLATGELLRWTWDRALQLAPGPLPRPVRPGHRFQRFLFAVVTRTEARDILVARLRAALAAAGLEVRALSVDAVYEDVHSLAVLGGKNLHTEVAASRTDGFNYSACVRLIRGVRCEPTRARLLELLLLAGLDAAVRGRPREGLAAALDALAEDLRLDPANAARFRQGCARVPEPAERAKFLGALDRLVNHANV